MHRAAPKTVMQRGKYPTPVGLAAATGTSFGALQWQLSPHAMQPPSDHHTCCHRHSSTATCQSTMPYPNPLWTPTIAPCQDQHPDAISTNQACSDSTTTSTSSRLLRAYCCCVLCCCCCCCCCWCCCHICHSTDSAEKAPTCCIPSGALVAGRHIIPWTPATAAALG